ncbi:facilitated trehalose transporter Tret1-like [Sitodiplosis mosellana]|uniref:facilitated trehalose transporter Tret1-like n=1 Tax=Sitodiplosis mosellana TaxID=263140 RepID=UPI002444DA77|nr:facilitated trehalose transporter Tret1-like [Sitodiplosis mosellana]
MGLGFGLKEASSLTYTGEVCETSIRGVMLATAGIFASMGYFLVYSMGAFLSWRNVAKICISVPICIFTAVSFIPETPIWLLSKNRQKEAQKSLQWLRGCVTSEMVHEEYQQLQEYCIVSNSCVNCAKQTIKCEHTESLNDKLKQITRRRIIKPFILITSLQFFLQFCAINSWRPYMIQILKAYTVRWDGNMVTVVLSSLGFVGRLILLPILKTMGKRRIYLASSLVTFLCCFGLSAIGFTFFPSTDWSSFEMASPSSASNSTITSSSMNATALRESVGNYSYLALALILIMQFAVNSGISMVPFILISEVFPFKLRSMLCSITTTDRYIFVAISSKIYYNIETWFSLPGAAAFYGFISLTGFIVMYLILPETEGRSLQDIEIHFSDNSRRITDIQIRRNQPDCEITK